MSIFFGFNEEILTYYRELWDQFLLLRMNTGIGYFFGTAVIFATELEYIREDRHTNIFISGLLQYFYLVAGSFFCMESVAVFR